MYLTLLVCAKRLLPAGLCEKRIVNYVAVYVLVYVAVLCVDVKAGDQWSNKVVRLMIGLWQVRSEVQ